MSLPGWMAAGRLFQLSRPACKDQVIPRENKGKLAAGGQPDSGIFAAKTYSTRAIINASSRVPLGQP